MKLRLAYKVTGRGFLGLVLSVLAAVGWPATAGITPGGQVRRRSASPAGNERALLALVNNAAPAERGSVIAGDEPCPGILLDMRLPHVHGAEVARAVGRRPELVDTPVAAVISCAMAGGRERIVAAGRPGAPETPIGADMLVADVTRPLSRPPSDGRASR